MPVKHDTYTGWGRVLSATGDRARPEKIKALTDQLTEAPSPALGALRSYGDAALNSDGPVVDMSRLDRLIAFDGQTGVLEAEAGVTLSDILRIFAPKGWMPATMPGTGLATLGGAIAADVHGKNHHAVGTFGQHVISMDLIGPDGVLRRVSKDTEPEIFDTTLGGMGLTGVIASAQIRLASCGAGHVDVTERRIANLSEYLKAFEDSTSTFSVGWIDATATGASMGRGIFEEAEFSTRVPGPAKAAKSRGVPLTPPSFLLSGPVVQAFNSLYFRRIPETGRTRTRSLISFFHPLDGLHGWNKLYGKTGFHQFQCVLPPEPAAMVLDRMMRDISASGLAAPLAVLKKMGAGRAGPLSFPMEGYTLAVDFPNRSGAAKLIDRLEKMCRDAGGRIYLAKDALTGAASIPEMYPELDTFRAAVRMADPDGVFATDLARRLELRGAA